MKSVKPDTCKHFNGIQNSKCEAGVDYRDLAGPPSNGYATRLPCWTAKEIAINGPKATCAHFCLPSAEELKVWDDYVNEAIKRQLKCSPLIVAFKKEYKRRSGHVIRVCPNCGGNLHMSISSYNGHVHGKCETAGCVEWME